LLVIAFSDDDVHGAHDRLLEITLSSVKSCYANVAYILTYKRILRVMKVKLAALFNPLEANGTTLPDAL